MDLNGNHISQSPEHPNLKQLSKEDLAEILKQHKVWLDSKGTKGRAANFVKTDLRGASLVGLNLAQANFKEAYLYGAYLKKSNLQSAKFSDANLRGANLRWANLKKADLKHTNLMKADMLNADLREADMREAKNLQCDQLKSATIDQLSILPSYIKITWTTDKLYECKIIKE